MPVSYTHLDVYKRQSAKGGDGSVYMINFKSETDQAWQDLAVKYTDETGVQVTVVTAADGQYKTTLKSCLLYTSRCV